MYQVSNLDRGIITSTWGFVGFELGFFETHLSMLGGFAIAIL